MIRNPERDVQVCRHDCADGYQRMEERAQEVIYPISLPKQPFCIFCQSKRGPVNKCGHRGSVCRRSSRDESALPMRTKSTHVDPDLWHACSSRGVERPREAYLSAGEADEDE
jgi:hypothetical protein